MKDQLVVVAGGGGFIGGSLVADLRNQGFKKIRAVDIKPFEQWYQISDDVENLSLDLNLKDNCETAAQGAYQIFNLAANMGGMGFIENNKALCMLSVLINTHMLQAARKSGVAKFFYSSSACVYNGDKQRDPDNPGLKEEDAYPLWPKTATVGRSCSASGCAVTSRKTSVSTPAWRVSTTSTGPTGPGTEAVRRRRPRFAARSSKPS